MINMKIKESRGLVEFYAETIDELLELEELVERGYAKEGICRRSFTMKVEMKKRDG